jgi:hypothetical protein
MATENNNTLISPDAIVEQLRAVRSQIPEYSQLTSAGARTLRAASGADRSFVQASINAVGASVAVQSALGVPAEAMRAEADEAMRWSAVEDELRAMLKGVAAANLTRRHRIGLNALQAYAISRVLVRKPEHADLLPHVAEMKRTNRFGRSRVKADPELKKKPTTSA